MRTLHFLFISIILDAACITSTHAKVTLRPLPNAERMTGVSAHAFSHSGKILALANETEIRLWNLRSKRFTQSFHLPTSYCHYPAMVFGPKDSTILLTACQAYEYGGGMRAGVVNEFRINIFSVLSLNLKSDKITTIDSDLHNCNCALAPDGIRFAELTMSGKLSLREIGHDGPLATASMPPRREWPNEYRLNFSQDGSKLIAYWFGQLLIYDAQTLGSRKFIEDSLEWETPEVLGSTVFLSRNPNTGIPLLIDIQKCQLAKTQPNLLTTQYSYMRMPTVTRALHPVGAAIVSNGQYLIQRYEVTTTGIPYEGGPRLGTDTLLITPLENPNQRWGIALDPSVKIYDVPINVGRYLLINNSGHIQLLNLQSREVDDIGKQD